MASSVKSTYSPHGSSSQVPLSSSKLSISASKTPLADFSVDEIFVQYSVPQIQKLQQEYKANFVQAKDDLHHLVGEKYRDLIRIAEDIDDLSGLSRQIDSQLTDLSYKLSSSVEFGKNPFKRFDSTIRHQRARLSRHASHKTILNNVINNKLIGYDLKLQTDSLRKTSTLVSVAKLYYTVGTIFSETLKDNPHVSANLHHLKGNFTRYLEEKISSYSSASSEIVPGGLNITNFFVDDHKLSLSDDENFELFTGAFEDEEQDFSDEEETDLADKAYRGSSNPIANYLMAYIIVKHDDPELNDLQKITLKFADLRFQYLKKFVSQALESGKQRDASVNFTLVFQFIETTCSHIHKYFLSDDQISNDLKNHLKYISTWNASELIGFHNWFEEETVIFDNASYKILDADAAKTVQAQLLKFGEFIYELASKLVNEQFVGSYSQKASKVLSILHHFVFGLRKCEVLFLSYTSECHTVRLISTQNVVSKFLADVTKVIYTFFSEHREQLVISDLSIISQILKDLKTNATESFAFNHFDPEFINLIDVDVDQYFESVLEISASNNRVTEREENKNSCQELKHWFYVLEDLLDATEISDANVLGRTLRIFKRDFKEVDGLTKKWGDFDPENFLAQFEILHKDQVESTRIDLESFIVRISSELKSHFSESDVNKLHFFLNLFIILKDNINAIERKSTDSSLGLDISEQVQKIFELIFEVLPSRQPEGRTESMESLLRKFAVIQSDIESATVPTKPHLAVHSTIYELSRSLLDSLRFRQHEISGLFTDAGVRDIFITTKNQWIKDQIIDNIIIAEIKNKTSDIKAKSETEEPRSSRASQTSTANPLADIDKPVSGSGLKDDTQPNTLKLEERDSLELNDNWNDDNEWPDEDADELLENENEVGANGESKNTNTTPEQPADDTNSTQESESKAKQENETSKKSEVIEEETAQGTDELSSGQIRRALANIIFVLNLTTKENIRETDPDLQRIISSLEKSLGIQIEDSALDIILRGVNDFYKSSKELYMPLLVN